MFKVRDNKGTWLKPWKRFAGNKYRFIRLAEELTKHFPETEIWVTFQPTILDDTDIVLVGNKETPGVREGTVKVEEPCWLLCRSLVKFSDWEGCYNRRYFHHFGGMDWKNNNLVNGGNRFKKILDVIYWVSDGEPFAVLQLKKIGPEQRFLLTVVKEFQAIHLEQIASAA